MAWVPRLLGIPISVGIVLATVTVSPAGAQAKGPEPPPPAPVSVNAGGVDANLPLEPGKTVDGVIAILNALGFRGADLSLGPGGLFGLLPSVQAQATATGAVDVKAGVKSCPAGSMCFYESPKYAGGVLILSPAVVKQQAEKGSGCLMVRIQRDDYIFLFAQSYINNSTAEFVVYPYSEGCGRIPGYTIDKNTARPTAAGQIGYYDVLE